MKVVVTGATGNVGTALLAALQADEAVESVVGVARRPPGSLADHLPKVTWRSVDISADPLGEVVAGADAVVHLAWLLQPSRRRDVMRRTNVEGSRRLFAATADAGVPALIHASSVGAYSRGPKDRAVDESWPTDGIPTSGYSRDKADVERALDDLEAANPRMRVVRMRPGIIMQAAAAAEIARLFVGPLVPARLLRPSWLPVVPDLDGLRIQAVHTDDVAEAYRLALHAGVSGPFNLAADPVLDPASLSEALGARRVRLPVSVVRPLAEWSWRLHLQPTDVGWLDLALQVPVMDVGRAGNDLGWHPARSATEALTDLLSGFGAGTAGPSAPLAGGHRIGASASPAPGPAAPPS